MKFMLMLDIYTYICFYAVHFYLQISIDFMYIQRGGWYVDEILT